MNRKVVRRYIDEWITENYPDGIGKLAQASQIPTSSVGKIRRGWAPKHRGQRQRLAQAIGVAEDDLFPLSKEKRTAS